MTSQVKTDPGLSIPRPLSSGHRLHWYELGGVLGQGAYGITYAGRDINLDQTVAIKEYFPNGGAKRDGTEFVRPSGSDAEEAYTWGLTRFLDEAQTLAKFRHPAIVRVSSVFEANGTAYMVMDYERGKTLSELIKSKAIIGEPNLLAILLPLIDGLEHVHANGIIHRDIKPANIIMRSDGSPVLLDFGAARQALDSVDRQLTNIGTRGYAPFEQFDGSGESKQGPWTDIYSLGVMLYEIVSGERPADALRRGAMLMEGGKDPLRPLRQGELSQRYSAELLEAIEHALAFKVPDRPRSIEDWRGLYPVLNGKSRRSSDLSVISSVIDENNSAAAEKTFKNLDESVKTAIITESTRSQVRSFHVMVVDDEPFVLNLLKRILSRLGVEQIATATSGEAALATLASNDPAPDIVLIDLKMPEMDGLELLRRLGELESGCSVILISGEDERILRTAESLAKAHDLDILGFLQKPITPDALTRLLAKRGADRTRRPYALVPSVSKDELDEALRSGGVIAVFQPKVSVRSREVVGVEALARLRHPQRGILGPGAFIPLAEECGRMGDLTEAIFKQSVAQTGAWQASGIDLTLSVNVSTDSLEDLEFPDRIVKWAAAEGLHPSQIILEVTETRVMSNVRSSLETLSRLRLNGVRLSIDDFGTGYSSLEQLKQVPFTELKIDRAFVFGAARDPQARAILESSISLANRLKLDVVAEGVETQGDWDVIAELGCDVVQGFFVAKPMPGDELLDWIAEWSATS